MLSSGYNPNARENFLKIKMEEQTVPSAGFSPQPEYMTTPDYSYGVPQMQQQQQQHQHAHQQHNHQQQQQQQQQHQHHNQHQQQHQHQMHSSSGMNTCLEDLAESFDLSLLGDSDMATVPSPSSSWSPLGSMEPTSCHYQMSFYAASPPEFRAFSPDCKPFGEMQHHNNANGNNNNNNAAGANGNGSSNNNPTATPSSGGGSVALLDGLAYHSAAAVVDPLSNDDVTNNCSRTNNNILLKQCLEDHTFLEKYNFKPLDLDLPITALSNDVETSMDNTVPTGATTVDSTLELYQIEPVFDLAYEQIISDIQNSCRTLGISPDPVQWSVGDVQSWICYSLTSILGVERGTNSNSAATQNIIALWNIDGQRLCSMAEEDFRRRDPLNGVKIFANLELYKMAQWKSADLQQQSVSQHQQQQQQQQQQVVNEINSNGQMSGQQPFDLGRILLDSVTSSAGAYGAGCASPASCSGSSSMEQSPSPPTTSFADIKVELDDSLNQAGSSSASAKFSNPSSVDTSSSMRTSDDDEDDEEEEVEKPAAGAVVKPKACGTKNGAHIHLWQFLKELLISGQQHGSCIRWLDQSRGVFKIEDSVRVARLWGIRKNRPAMNYDKLSRSIRQYYRKGIMRKTERSQRLVYQFCHPYGL